MKRFIVTIFILFLLFNVVDISIAIGIVNVKDSPYLAKGDGKTDDALAIQKAIDVAIASTPPGTVYLPNGIYKITVPLVIKNKGVTFQGDGKNQTQILASGGINGINVIETASGSGLEGVILKDFRIYNDVNGKGIGINVFGMRHMSIYNVWIGGWYDHQIGFEKGIYCETNPAYYLTIERCILMRNTFGIYLVAGANDTRIDKNEIWYGDYSIYIDGGSAVRITNNACENYVFNAVYVKDHYDAYINGNYFESAGKPSIRLVGTTKNTIISYNSSAVWLYDKDDVLDESNNLTNQHGDYHIALRLNSDSSRDNAGGIISLDRTNIGGDITGYATDQLPNDILMRAVSGDWVFTNDLPHRGVDIQSKLDTRSINTPYGGTGTQFGNLIPYSEDFTQWTGGNIAVLANQALAPNGTLTADSISGNISIAGINANMGEAFNFSIWLKSPQPQNIFLYMYGTSIGSHQAIRTIRLTDYWKRYSVTGVCSTKTILGASIQIIGLGNKIYPIYAWGGQVNKYVAGIVSVVDNFGSDGRNFLYSSNTNFVAQGVDIGSRFQLVRNGIHSYGIVSEINSYILGTSLTGNVATSGMIISGVTSKTLATIRRAVVREDKNIDIEFDKYSGAFTSGETITWEGGSAIISKCQINVIVRYSDLTPVYGSSPMSINNGDTVYLLPSYMFIPPPYCATNGNIVDSIPSSFGTDILAANQIVLKDSVDGKFYSIRLVNGALVTGGTIDPKPKGGYNAPYGLGDRRAVINVTNTIYFYIYDNINTFINGNKVEQRLWTSQSNVGKYIRFKFPEAIVIEYIKWIQQGKSTHGTFVVQGSNNGVDWDNIGSQFILGGDAIQHIDISNNSKAYLYYQLLGIKGDMSSTDWIYEVEFSWKYKN